MGIDIPAIITGTVLSIVSCISICCCLKSEVDRMGAPVYTGADYIQDRIPRQNQAMTEAWARAEQPSTVPSVNGSLSIPGPVSGPNVSFAGAGSAVEMPRTPSEVGGLSYRLLATRGEMSNDTGYFTARTHLSPYPSSNF
jgi:hypothetical protein